MMKLQKVTAMNFKNGQTNLYHLCIKNVSHDFPIFCFIQEILQLTERNKNLEDAVALKNNAIYELQAVSYPTRKYGLIELFDMQSLDVIINHFKEHDYSVRAI